MVNFEIKRIPHAELLQAYTQGDRVFGMILPCNCVPAMSVDVLRVETDSVVV